MADTLVTEPPVTPPVSPSAPTSPAGTPPVPASPVTPSTPDWRASLPPDLQAHKGLEKFKDPVALVRSYIQMEQYQGRSVAIPGPDAKPEERAAFYQKLGVPDAPEKYAITAPENAGPLDTGLVKSWQSVFHRLNLTPEQAAGLTSEFFGSPMGNPTMAGEQLRGTAESTLKAEWGGAYAHNLKTAQEAVRLTDRQSGAGLLPLLEQTGLGNHPAVIKHFAWLGKQFAEAGDLPRDAKSGDILGPNEAQARITELMNTPEYRRGDRSTVDEVQRLFQLKTSAGM